MQFAGYHWPSDFSQLRQLGADGIETGGKAVGMGLREYWRGGCGEQGERVCSEMHTPLDTHTRTLYSGGCRADCVRPLRFRPSLNGSRNQFNIIRIKQYHF